MHIGLIDVDSHNFPNLALMKISAYEKSKGNYVEWWNGFDYYDKVYKSKVFTDLYSKDTYMDIDCDELILGGTGYDLYNLLPDEIEHQYPDYSLYYKYTNDIAYGFLTRGCPRNCSFCIVSEKEGLKSFQVASLDEFWRGQHEIKLLDPNIVAAANSEKLFEELSNTKAWIDFTQGLDARLINDEHIYYINKMKVKMIHFAWDNYEFQTYKKLKAIRPLLKLDKRRLKVYVLTNFNTTHEQDYERVTKLCELGYDPYIMIYDKPTAPQNTRYLQRYVNNKIIFNSCSSFAEYNPKLG